MKNYELSVKVQKAQDFLMRHPGVGFDGGFFSMNFNYWMVDVCKNDVYKDYFQKPENVEVTLYKSNEYLSDDYIKRYDGMFEKFFDKYKDEDDDDEIYVPYKEVFGYEWKYDHTYYKGEYDFLKYNKNEDLIKYILSKGKADEKEAEKIASYYNMHYNSFQGGTVKADSYEEMIIKIADDVRENYGNYSYEDFLTQEEKDNHKNEWLMKFKDLNDGSGHSEMLTNPKYIRVEDYELNQRWFEWFTTTDYCKENWGWIIDEEHN